MYAKLFRGNIRKTLRDYLVYFFTLVVSSTLFFAFLSLTSRYNDILGGDGNYSLALFQDTIRYAVLAVSFIFIVLVRYINSHMLRQRSREFSVYMILGMEQRTVAGQFFREIFVMGVAVGMCFWDGAVGRHDAVCHEDGRPPSLIPAGAVSGHHAHDLSFLWGCICAGRGLQRAPDLQA